MLQGKGVFTPKNFTISKKMEFDLVGQEIEPTIRRAGQAVSGGVAIRADTAGIDLNNVNFEGESAFKKGPPATDGKAELRVAVGQKISLTAEIVGWGPVKKYPNRLDQGGTVNWTINGSIVKNYITTSKVAKVIEFQESDRHEPTITYAWIDGDTEFTDKSVMFNNMYKVNCIIDDNLGYNTVKHYNVSTYFHVEKPDAQFVTPIIALPVEDSFSFLYPGHWVGLYTKITQRPLLAGIEFKYHATAGRDGVGRIAIVQILKSENTDETPLFRLRNATLNPNTKKHDYFVDNATDGVGGWFYETPVRIGATSSIIGSTEDSPAFRVDIIPPPGTGLAITHQSREDFFRTHIIFRSSKGVEFDNIWIPLKRVPWHWFARMEPRFERFYSTERPPVEDDPPLPEWSNDIRSFVRESAIRRRNAANWERK